MSNAVSANLSSLCSTGSEVDFEFLLKKVFYHLSHFVVKIGFWL